MAVASAARIPADGRGVGSCDVRSRSSYPWPLTPFDRQHPIRGFFGDPRTVFWGSGDPASSRTAGSFSFHNGVDISAPPGTPVYPVVSGIVMLRHPAAHRHDEVIVHTLDRRSFQYWHIDAVVHSGQDAIAGKTVLGYVQREARHVHLSEIDGTRIVNPLAPGHLWPYVDTTAPTVDSIEIRSATGTAVDPRHVRGTVQIVAAAFDQPPLEASPALWADRPVAPAFLAWQLSTSDGSAVVAWRPAVDFRRTLPPRRAFWRVYARGSYQNFPVVDYRLQRGLPGRYLYRLAGTFDANALQTGNYRLSVTAADSCGNQGVLEQALHVDGRSAAFGRRLPGLAALLGFRRR